MEQPLEENEELLRRVKEHRSRELVQQIRAAQALLANAGRAGARYLFLQPGHPWLTEPLADDMPQDIKEQLLIIRGDELR